MRTMRNASAMKSYKDRMRALFEIRIQFRPFFFSRKLTVSTGELMMQYGVEGFPHSDVFFLEGHEEDRQLCKDVYWFHCAL